MMVEDRARDGEDQKQRPQDPNRTSVKRPHDSQGMFEAASSQLPRRAASLSTRSVPGCALYFGGVTRILVVPRPS